MTMRWKVVLNGEFLKKSIHQHWDSEIFAKKVALKSDNISLFVKIKCNSKMATTLLRTMNDLKECEQLQSSEPLDFREPSLLRDAAQLLKASELFYS